MAGMARHGSVGAFSGFSVCQPALGASVQWLPALGTAELDDMINAFLPGPASLREKRLHIAMDFCEYSRQTGETIKFYPVPSASFTPATTSPAASAFYDSGSVASFNNSPVLSEGSWTQSPASSVPAASDARTKSRPSAAKKSSASSSRAQTLDFANHPGMRILTKDGRDVTNSASRGCKTKEQRDHAHLMRIIKACDTCKKKKVRCDPSHRKRTASQASAAQAEQKPAKKPRKAEEPAPVAVVDAAADFTAAGASFGPESLAFPSLDLSYADDAKLWDDFVTLQQEPVAAAPSFNLDFFDFDSFTNTESFVSPSFGSTATSPSQVLTPVTPTRLHASPTVAADVSAVDVAGDVTFGDLALPYLNPDVALGTDYLDFNLYSPPAEVYDEDPVLQMRDLGSHQQSPQSVYSPHLAVLHTVAQNSPRISATSVGEEVARVTSTGQQSGVDNHTVITSPADVPWYYDPGDTGPVEPEPSTHRSLQMTNHNRLVEGGGGGGGGRGTALGQQVARGSRHANVHASTARAASLVESPVLAVSAPAVSSSTVVANIAQSSVSPGAPARSRRIAAASSGSLGSSSPNSSPVSTLGAQSGALGSDAYVEASLRTVTARRQPPQHAATTASPAAGDTVPATVVRSEPVCASSPMLRQPVAGDDSKSSACHNGRHVVLQQPIVAAAPLATIPALPTRRNVAGKEDAMSQQTSPSFFQLVAFGLVSVLCASAVLQAAHLASSQVTLLLNILFITSISLARLAAALPKCSAAGPVSSSSAVQQAAPTMVLPLLPLAPSGVIDFVKSTAQAVAGSSMNFQSTASRWARRAMPRLPPTVRTLGPY